MFKDRLKKLRCDNNLTQQELAELVFVSRSTIAKWENGIGIPSDINIKELCKFFNVDYKWLLGIEEKEENIEDNIKKIKQIMSDECSSADIEQYKLEFKKSQDKLIFKGKLIVYLIVCVALISTIIVSIQNFNWIYLVLQIVISISLLRGVTWIKYFVAIDAGITGIGALFMLLVGIDFSSTDKNTKLVLLIYFGLLLIYKTFTCLILFKSKAISEYLYSKRY